MRGLSDDEFRVLGIACAPGEDQVPSDAEQEILMRLVERGLVDYSEQRVPFSRRIHMHWTVNALGRLAHRVEAAFRSAPRP